MVTVLRLQLLRVVNEPARAHSVSVRQIGANFYLLSFRLHLFTKSSVLSVESAAHVN